MKCSISRCREESDMTVLGQPLCNKHWIIKCRNEEQTWTKQKDPIDDRKGLLSAMNEIAKAEEGVE